MSEKQKTLRIISIIELVTGILYFVEGIIVATGKSSYFVSGAFTVITALYCLQAVTDSSKAKTATILLWISIVLDLLGMVLAIFAKASVTEIALVAVGVCICAYMVKLIKEIHA